MTFNRAQIQAATLAGVRAASGDWETMLATILRAIADRHARHPDYPFIDTKLHLLTGQDFPELPDQERDFKGRTAVYGWIQGRGLEALVGHVRWLPRCRALPEAERAELAGRIHELIVSVARQLEVLRAKNFGHLSFLLTPEGRAFDMDESGRRRYFSLERSGATMSDLFYVKGMLAAAHYLNDATTIEAARGYFRSIVAGIEAGTFRSDGVTFDPKNKVTPVPGRFGHGSRMIALGACALFAGLLGEDEWFDAGARFIRHILDRYVITRPTAGFELYDMYEFTGADAQPWLDGGRIVSDPGHATEFVGLAARFLLLLDRHPRKSAEQARLLDDCRAILQRVLDRNFRNGFNARVGGICKTFDLRARQPINSDMPWWNLPETMRAAAFIPLLAPGADRARMFEIIQGCSNGFMRTFVNERVHLMAYQTVNAEGTPVDVIPATADADPGYHTGLSIIDYLDSLNALI